MKISVIEVTKQLNMAMIAVKFSNTVFKIILKF